MPASFDGENLIITLPSGETEIDAETDLYSDWKEWFKTGSNARYPVAFRTSGGDPLSTTLDAGSYFFLRNDFGWRIRPAEEDATVNILGNLVAEDVTLPILIPTIGTYRVLVLGIQPITQAIEIPGEGATATEIADAVWDEPTAGHTTSGTFGESLGTLDISGVSDKLNEIWQLHGLDASNPLVVTATSRIVNLMTQTITQSGGVVTITRL